VYLVIAQRTASFTFRSTRPSGSALDPVGHLYSASGALLATNDDGAGNANFRIKANLTRNTLYWLAVKGYATTTGAFTLTTTSP